MFKVIRDFVEKPRFLIICDRSCGTYAFAEIGAASGASDIQNQAHWARTLQEQGWSITLAEHVCPAHVKKDKEGESLIVLPSMAASAYKN